MKRNQMKCKLEKTVFVIGFMGAGKTTLCRRMAKNCSCESLDVDVYIERMRGEKISAIFEEVGEAGFRDIETMALKRIAESDHIRFVSCGGGIVMRDENVEIMKENGVVLHLYSDAYNGEKRISNKKTRPLFNDVKEAQKLFQKRLPLYENAANLTLDTTGKTSGKVFWEALDLLKKHGLIKQVQ